MKKYNILIHGGTLSDNEGAAAMTIVTAKILKNIFPNSIITVSSIFQDEALERNKNYNYRIILKREVFNITKNPKIFFGQFTNLNSKFKMLLEYHNTDLVVDVTGDMYSDSYGPLVNFCLLKELLYPILFKKPIIIFPQSIGPFRSKFTYNFARFIFNRCKVVIAREEITKKLLDGMNLKTRVELIDDSAFLLKPVPRDELDVIVKEQNIKKANNMLIGLSLSQSIANYSKAGTSEKYEEYLQKMTNLVDYLTELGQVVLISHVGGEANKVNDDLIISELIYNRAKNKDRVTFINRRYRPEEWKGIISLCDLLIGARMHANIAALSTNVPTIAIAYSHKFYGIMGRFGQSKYVVDIMKLSYEEIIEKVNEVLSNKNVIIEQLKQKNTKIENNKKILSSIIKNAILK